MAKLRINLACGIYDRTVALADGSVEPEGVDLNFVPIGPAELFSRMLHNEEFDVSEFSLSNYLTLLSRGDNRFVAIPVFPYRAFRHSMIWVNANSRIREPRDLAGKRIGIPQYSVTALLFLRGMLMHEYGVKPQDLEWFQSDPPLLELNLPRDLRLVHMGLGTHTGQVLDEMLEDCKLDAVANFFVPRGSYGDSPHLHRLFDNVRQVEIDYFRATGIFPIMHIIAVRHTVYERNRWLAQSLVKAFHDAKEKCYERIRKLPPLYSLTPWLRLEMESSQRLFGEDMYPYGVTQNLPTLSAAALYSYEQGLSQRQVSVDEMFANETVNAADPKLWGY
jgi:4,5-dihydroxyphthalate decarboxylase